MSLVKTSLLNGIAVVVKVAAALVINKILALYVGPAGYAIIGQFQNAISIVVNLAGGVLAVGVTKTTAQNFDNQFKQHAVWKTAIRLSLCTAALAGVSLIISSDWLSTWLLHRADMSGVFLYLAIALPAMVFNILLLAILNGKKEIGIYIKSNILGSLTVMLVTGILAYSFGLYGALVAFAISPAITLLSTAILCSNLTWLKASFLWGEINRPSMHELTGLGLMGLTSALVMPATFIIIRDHLTRELGVTQAGYWQASWKISEIYLMLVTSTLSVYYLPRLAEIRTSVELKQEIIKVYKFVMPIVMAGSLLIFLLKNTIIEILFTPDFLPMGDLFPWQLTGDVIKIASLVLAYIMLGRAMVKIYIFTEIFFSIIFIIFTWIFVGEWGLRGVAMAYAANYFLYLIFMAYLIKNEIKNIDNPMQKKYA